MDRMESDENEQPLLVDHGVGPTFFLQLQKVVGLAAVLSAVIS